MRVTGRADVEHFCLGIGERSVSRTFKRWGKKCEFEDKKEERSDGGEEPEWEGTKCLYTGGDLQLGFCLNSVSLDPITNHLGFACA